jgi:hypothetical protein
MCNQISSSLNYDEFVVSGVQIIFRTQCSDIFTIFLPTKFHIPVIITVNGMIVFTYSNYASGKTHEGKTCND